MAFLTRLFWLQAWRPPGKLLGLQRFQRFPGDPALYAHLPHCHHLGAHPQSFVTEREDGQRPQRFQRSRECELTQTERHRLLSVGHWRASCFQGLEDENQERGQLLGAYSYDLDGAAVQTFAISVSALISNKDVALKKGQSGRALKSCSWTGGLWPTVPACGDPGDVQLGTSRLHLPVPH